MAVRAKFRMNGIKDAGYGTEVTLNAVYGNGQDNKSWSEATPNGQLTMTITNKAAVDQFQIGKEYYLDIIEAVPPTPQPKPEPKPTKSE